MKDGILLEVTNWGWKFENGDVVPTLAHQVISCYYYWYRRAILFLLFYGSPRILIFIGAVLGCVGLYWVVLGCIV